MKTTKSIVIVLSLVLLTAGAARSMEQARETSPTLKASCLIQVTSDPAIFPINYETIEALMYSSGVGGKAAREILQISPDDMSDIFIIEILKSGGGKGTTGLAPRSSTAKGPNETTAQYQGRIRAEAAARARAVTARRRMPQPAPASSVDGQTYLFGLNVNLPDDLKSVAKEFMRALVENLRHALRDSYDAHVEELQSLRQFAEDRRDIAQTKLAEAMERVKGIKVTPEIKLDPADAAVHEQLEQIVDLSNLTQTMTFEDVLMEVKNAVDPPLQIQPNWRDLLDLAELEPTTPAGMDPLSSVKLRKALELLLAGVSSDFAEVGHVVDEGVIVIATEDALPKKMVSRVYDVPALAHSTGSARSLVQAIKESIEPESWFELSNTGEGTIGVYMGSKLAILQTDDVQLKILEFLQSMTTNIPASTTPQIPPEMLLSEKRNLFREKQNIQMEIARLLARQSAIERQIIATEMQIAEKLKSDPVTAELQQLIELHTSQLALMEREFQAGTLPVTGLADIKEKITRAKIELAQRHEQLSRSAGGDQLVKYNNELADKTIEFAEKTAALQILSEQLGQAEQQFIFATILDPQVSRIRLATRAFEIADQRLDELNARSANLRPPVVSMLGGK